MKKIIIGIIAAAVLVTGAVFVVAQRAGHGGRGHFGPGGPMMALRGLDLTADQKAKVKDIFTASRAEVQPLMQQMRENRQKMAALGTDGKFDQAAVEALAADQAGIMSKLTVEREKAKAQVFALLTDDQRSKAAAMRQKFDERMKDHADFAGKGEGAEL